MAVDRVLPPRPLQFSVHILLAAAARLLDPTLPAAIDPVAQGRKADPESLDGLAPQSAAALGAANRHILEVPRHTSLRFGQGNPPAR